eukprot:TRINITY_DN36174_c0_g1_i1.p1 TRINITY_DN36174_c0_g1~~TRINITY_DN36174_c0_g1_i1.p1  ORF type:complete len:1386 (+),score=403.45 TRINITY_DN36174_c0_g1_i1:74-4231(+)
MPVTIVVTDGPSKGRSVVVSADGLVRLEAAHGAALAVSRVDGGYVITDEGGGELCVTADGDSASLAAFKKRTEEWRSTLKLRNADEGVTVEAAGLPSRGRPRPRWSLCADEDGLWFRPLDAATAPTVFSIEERDAAAHAPSLPDFASRADVQSMVPSELVEESRYLQQCFDAPLPSVAARGAWGEGFPVRCHVDTVRRGDDPVEQLAIDLWDAWDAAEGDVFDEIVNGLRTEDSETMLRALSAAAARMEEAAAARSGDSGLVEGLERITLLAVRMYFSSGVDLDALIQNSGCLTGQITAADRAEHVLRRRFDPRSNCWWRTASPYADARRAVLNTSAKPFCGGRVKWLSLLAVLATRSQAAPAALIEFIDTRLQVAAGSRSLPWHNFAREAAVMNTTYAVLATDTAVENFSSLEEGDRLHLPSLASVTVSPEAAVAALRHHSGGVLLEIRGFAPVLMLRDASHQPQQCEMIAAPFQVFFVEEAMVWKKVCDRNCKTLRLGWERGALQDEFVDAVLADARAANERLVAAEEERLARIRSIDECCAVRRRSAADSSREIARINHAARARDRRHTTVLRVASAAGASAPPRLPCDEIAEYGAGERRAVPSMDEADMRRFGRFCEDLWRRKDNRGGSVLDEIIGNLRAEQGTTREEKLEPVRVASKHWSSCDAEALPRAQELGFTRIAGVLLRLYQQDGVQTDRLLLLPGAPRGPCTDDEGLAGRVGNLRRWKAYADAHVDDAESNVGCPVELSMGEAARVTSGEQLSGTVWKSRTAGIIGMKLWVKSMCLMAVLAEDSAPFLQPAPEHRPTGCADKALYAALSTDRIGGRAAIIAAVALSKGQLVGTSCHLPVRTSFDAAARELRYAGEDDGGSTNSDHSSHGSASSDTGKPADILIVFTKVPEVVRLLPRHGAHGGPELLVPFLSLFSVAERPQLITVQHPDDTDRAAPVLRIVLEYHSGYMSRDLAQLSAADATRAERHVANADAEAEAAGREQARRLKRAEESVAQNRLRDHTECCTWRDPVTGSLVSVSLGSASPSLVVHLPGRDIRCGQVDYVAGGPLVSLAVQRGGALSPHRTTPPVVLHLPPSDPGVVDHLAALADEAGVGHNTPPRGQLLLHLARVIEETAQAELAAAPQRPPSAPRGRGITLEDLCFLQEPPRGAPLPLLSLFRQLPAVAEHTIRSIGVEDTVGGTLGALMDLHSRVERMPQGAASRTPLSLASEGLCLALMATRHSAGEDSVASSVTAGLVSRPLDMFARPAVVARLAALGLADRHELRRTAVLHIDDDHTPHNERRDAEHFLVLLDRFVESDEQRSVASCFEHHVGTLATAPAEKLAEGARVGPDDLRVAFTVAEMRRICDREGLPVDGDRCDLIRRLSRFWGGSHG